MLNYNFAVVVNVTSHKKPQSVSTEFQVVSEKWSYNDCFLSMLLITLTKTEWELAVWTMVVPPYKRQLGLNYPSSSHDSRKSITLLYTKRFNRTLFLPRPPARRCPQSPQWRAARGPSGGTLAPSPLQQWGALRAAPGWRAAPYSPSWGIPFCSPSSSLVLGHAAM